MHISLWVIGKTNFKYLVEGMQLYGKRINRYVPFSLETIPDVRMAGKMNPQQLKEKEAEAVIKKLQEGDFLILLDEKGTQMTSPEFSKFIENLMVSSQKRVILLIGGAYGVSETLKKRADYQMSLSKMTFSHQMIRVFILEQVYRAFSILKGEPYHNH